MLGIRRKKPALQAPVAPSSKTATTVCISHQPFADHYVSRFFCTEEVLRSYNDTVVSAVRLVVMPNKDKKHRPAIRFHRYYVAVSWIPADDLAVEIEELNQVMLDTLSRLFGVDIMTSELPSDADDPLVFINAIIDTSRRLGVDWSPVADQR